MFVKLNLVIGGETPITSSIHLANSLQKHAPDFVDQLLHKGVKYVYRYGVEEVKSNTGTSVIGAYGQEVLPNDDPETIRGKIEAEVRRHSNRFEWHDDGSLSVTHIVPGMNPECNGTSAISKKSSYSKTRRNRSDDLVRKLNERIR